MEHDAIIIASLRAPDAKGALAEAVRHADALAPTVYGLASKFCEGIYLLPADSNLLFNGLHVLAAARHPSLCDHLIEIVRQPDDELNQLFPDHAPASRALSSVCGIAARSRCSPSSSTPIWGTAPNGCSTACWRG